MSVRTLDEVTAIQLTDQAGLVLLNVAVPTPAPTITPPSTETKVPTNLDWYRDATKWLVTISGAAIVFGYGFVAATGSDDSERLAFTVSSSVLLMSILGGIVCHFWILKWANAFEGLAVATEHAKITSLEESKAKAAKWLQFWYHVMMWPFFAGMVSFTFFCGFRVWHSKASEPPEPIVFSATVAGETSIVFVDHRRHSVWLLKRSGAKVVWERVTSFPPP
jgi:hypothetical protein